MSEHVTGVIRLEHAKEAQGAEICPCVGGLLFE